MTDLVQIPANVMQLIGACDQGTAGEEVTAGEIVYLEDANYKWLKAYKGCTHSPTLLRIALNSAYRDQPIMLFKWGSIDIGATLEVGKTYGLSDTPGAICESVGDTFVIGKAAAINRLERLQF